MKSNTVHKKWKKIGIGLILLMLLMILGGILWWEFQSPVSSGLYVERESAYHLMEKDSASHMDFAIPVVWVRSSPLDDHTEVENVSLIDHQGNEVFIVEGSYYFRPDSGEDRWFNRVVRGEIELPLNIIRIVDDWGIMNEPLGDLKETYRLDSLLLTHKEEELAFSLQDRYSLQVMEYQPSPGPEAGEMNGFSPIYDEDDVLIGFIYELERVRDHEITKVHYWLPGMDESYFERLRIEGDQTRDDAYLNAFEGFEGDLLSMPHRIDHSRILVYFPITEEIEEKADKSILRIMPYFEMKKPDGETYFIGGGGQWGPYPRNTPWHEMLIEGSME